MVESKKVLVVGLLAKDEIKGKEFFGGSAGIVSVALAQLGIKTGVFTASSRDEFGLKYEDYIKRMGVNGELIHRVLERYPICKVLSSGNEQGNSTWEDYDCHQTMDAIEPDMAKVNNYRYVHLASSPSLLARKFLNCQSTIFYEPGPVSVFDPEFVSQDLLKRATVVFFNESEYAVVRNKLGITCEDFLLASGDQMVVTKGEQGSVITVRDDDRLQEVEIPAVKPVAPISDHIGAGDCYKAGYIVAYLKGRSPEQAGSFGALLGSYSVTITGGFLPSALLKSFAI